MAGMRAHVNHGGTISPRTTNPHFHYYAQMFDIGGNDVLNEVTVQLSFLNILQRPFRDRGASARQRPSSYRRLGTAVAIAGFALQTVTLVGAAALPEDTPGTPSPASTSSSTSTGTSTSTSTDAAAADPTVPAAPTPKPTSPIGRTLSFSFSAPSFSPTNAVLLTGTKVAGGSVVVTPAAGGMALCSITASSATDFSCNAAIASGRGIALRAVETLDGEASAPLSATVDVLGAPTIGGAPDTFTTGLVSGYGFAGSTVTAVFDGGAIGCSAVASDAGYWSCALTVPSGSYVIRATQSRADLGGGASSSLSDSLSLVVDRDTPPSAAITSPAAGTRVITAEVTFSGTGEMATPGHHGIADLYVDNVPACQAAIVAGLWSCSVRGMPPGAHSLLVIQRDSAGNYGAPSAPITVFFEANAGSIPPAPQAAPTSPGSPTPPKSPGSPSQTPSAPPPSGAPNTPTPDRSTPVAPTPSGPFDNWSTPTTFGTVIPALASSVSPDSLLAALLLALVFIVLVALPLRLLSGALRGRIRLPPLQLTGRNHSRPRGSFRAVTVLAPVNPWLAGALPLAAAVGFILIAGGVDDQVRYLRLTAAVVLGLAVLNVVGVAISTRIASRGQAVSGRLRFVPLLLLAALFAALVSRATDIHPPVIAGVLIGVGFTSAVGARARAIVGLVEIGAVTLLATAAWLFHGLFASASGFFAMFVDETLATVALAGCGSVIVLILPIATLPGRAVFEWSRSAWFAAVMVVALLGAVVVLGAGESPFPISGAVIVAGAFAALSVAVWGWLRFVDPAAAEAVPISE